MLAALAWGWTGLYVSLGLALIWLAQKSLRIAKAETLLPANFQFPKVTLIKPVKGVNSFTKINFSSWLNQRYPSEIEFIFSFQDLDDQSIPIVRDFMQEFSDRNIKLIVNPIRQGFSGKTSNLFYGVATAQNEFLIFSDADTFADEYAVREIVLRAEKDKKIVSCLPLHHSPEGLWAQLYTTLWNAVIVGLWGPAMAKEKSPAVSGGTVAFYKSDLEKIGGVESFASYVAEDIKTGSLFKNLGYELILGPAVTCNVGEISRGQCWDAFMRGAYVAWNNENGGVARAIPLYVFVYGYAILLPYAVFSNHPAALPLFMIYVTRVVAHSYYNWLANNKFNFAFHTYMSDLMLWCAFFYSFFKRELDWAGVRYKIMPSGRLEKI